MRTTLLSLLASFLCLTAISQNLLREGFGTYTVGSDLSGQGSWTNNSSGIGGLGSCVGILCSNLKVSGNAMAYANYGTSVRSVTVGPDMDNPGIGFTSVNTGSVYTSILVNFSSATATEGDILRVMGGSNFSTAARIYIKAGSGGYQVGVGKGTGSALYGVSPPTYPFNTTMLLVLKYTFVAGSSNDVVELLINPNMGNPEPAATLTINTGTDNVTLIDRLALRFGTSNMPAGEVGGITVSQSWGAGSVLPVNSLRDFNATRAGAGVSVTWNTQDESLITKYDLQYSSDGRNFRTIYTTTTGAGSYRFSHSPKASVNYYRLSITDIAAKTALSSIKTVLLRSDGAAITQVKGSGASYVVSISSNAVLRSELQVFNHAGALVASVPVSITIGEQHHMLDMSRYSTGVYYLKLKCDGAATARRLIRQ